MDSTPFVFDPAQLAAAAGTTYDPRAVAYCTAMQRLLAPLPRELHGHGAAIVNAIEHCVEEADGHPTVLRHLGDALLALVALGPLDSRRMKKLTQLLGALHSHVAATHQPRR